jgi:hypothetical protein
VQQEPAGSIDGQLTEKKFDATLLQNGCSRQRNKIASQSVKGAVVSPRFHCMRESVIYMTSELAVWMIQPSSQSMRSEALASLLSCDVAAQHLKLQYHRDVNEHFSFLFAAPIID